VLCVVLVLGVATAVAGECPIDNFDDRNDEGWRHCGEWSEQHDPVWDAGSGSYCLGLKDPVRTPPPPPLSIAAQWTGTGEDPRHGDGCLRVGFRAGTMAAGTWNTHFFVALRADCKNSGYKAMLGPSLGRISIYRRLALLADESGHPFEEGKAYRVEFCARGTGLSLKYWPLGGDEPAQPQLRASDKLFTVGDPGMGVFIENDNRGPILRGCFDDVRFVPAAHCAGDVDCSGAVDIGDLRAIVGDWGTYTPCHPRHLEDLDGDCAVGFSDTLAILKAWGACPAGS
jgi:hypothetical protein